MIIDTDPGHDDAIALVLAHRYAEVIGITTVAGNTSIQHATRNALRICDLVGADTPVYQGATSPLSAKAVFASEVHGKDGLGNIPLPDPSRQTAGENAVEYLLDMAEQDVWVVAIGPLTNIAQALIRDADWLKRLAGISLMGGSTHIGNVTPCAEFNVYFDPEAADVVFSAEGNLMMSGLNLTNQVQISQTDISQIHHSTSPSPLAQFAEQNFTQLLASIRQLTGSDEVAMHDPCALLAVTHPHWFHFEPRDVKVELVGTHTRGMTVVDERSRPSGSLNQIQVGYRASATEIKQLIFHALFDT